MLVINVTTSVTYWRLGDPCRHEDSCKQSLQTYWAATGCRWPSAVPSRWLIYTYVTSANNGGMIHTASLQYS
ncbi:unnamed protein product [Macrosiphum euphorbiae]|uniref:Uncharacterized protein n=1 Tax=Macrosiphum euphorbiae TaxID=13131 RepID=A0AAV0VYU0_9HEMI|nr:unnamed protein product [Macrosiphum euphorbiae]